MNGLLILDKPIRMSSAQAVAYVRKRAGDVKTGHAGTLDPLATGVLVLALGSATKSIERLMATEKRYRTEIDLSAFTTTDDREGERIEPACRVTVDDARLNVIVEIADTRQSTIINRQSIETALRHFTGGFLQKPPAYSAVKVGGKRAYAIARRAAKGKGDSPTIEPRPVKVHEMHLIEFAWPLVELDIRCGKGFYVRSLARDLGEALGVGGHCASIRRTAVGPYTIDIAKTIEQLPECIEQSDLLPAPPPLAVK
jgi:tRNA pseudouridine55 synthase